MFSTCSVVYSALNLAPRDSLFKLSLCFCSLLESCPHPLLLRVTCVFGSWVLCPWVTSLSNITLWVSPSIQVAILHLTIVKEVWDHLKENYGTPSIGNTYTELSWLLSTTIPTNLHPAPTITKMLSHFTYLKDAGFEFPVNIQAMVILCKLPPTMEVVAQILSQTSPSKIKTLKPNGIVKAVTLSFEQKGASHGSGGKAPQANKLSTVKHKQVDPKFAQQQQQQGGSMSRPGLLRSY